jgi:hypothetical protein
MDPGAHDPPPPGEPGRTSGAAPEYRGVEAMATSQRRSGPLAPVVAILISLVLIFLALVGIGNEIRYQGCVGRLDQQALVAVTANPKNPAPVQLTCHRLPFK